MIYQETLDWLLAQWPLFQRVGDSAFKKGLDNIVSICDHLGNPQHQFRSIHVAGTNGKGSVSAMLAAVFTENGYKTGLYTSPHLIDFTERIRIDGKMIPKERVISFVEENKDFFEGIKPSFFEGTTAMAFQYFAEEKVDVAIIETGLGGRLDSTNIIKPRVSVITHISHDHMDHLGSNLWEITREKAGIIKTSRPVILGKNPIEVQETVHQIAKETQSYYVYAPDEYHLEKKRSDLFTQEFDVFFKGEFTGNVTLSFAGIYQQENLATMLTALRRAKWGGYVFEKEKTISGLGKIFELTGFRGRMTVLQQKPLVVGDIAHNTAGLKIVFEQIAKACKGKLHIVFGMLKEKEIQSALSLFPKGAENYWVAADMPRSLSSEQLAAAAKKEGMAGEAYESVPEGVDAAIKNAAPEDLIFIGGSTFVLAEALPRFDA